MYGLNVEQVQGRLQPLAALRGGSRVSGVGASGFLLALRACNATERELAAYSRWAVANLENAPAPRDIVTWITQQRALAQGDSGWEPPMPPLSSGEPTQDRRDWADRWSQSGIGWCLDRAGYSFAEYRNAEQERQRETLRNALEAVGYSVERWNATPIGQRDAKLLAFINEPEVSVL